LPEEIACVMLGLKISLVAAFLFSLLIPFLIKPVNGLYDIGELGSLRAYCFQEAERAAQGQNVVNDLIKSGLANSTYYDWSCSKISETLQSESQAESQRQQEEQQAESQRQQGFINNCKYGNLTPLQYWDCKDAGYTPPDVTRICRYDDYDVLTPAEVSDCINAGHGPTEKDKDTKESDK
jgi:hypothetical protein